MAERARSRALDEHTAGARIRDFERIVGATATEEGTS
jgi:hypothetical protein